MRDAEVGRNPTSSAQHDGGQADVGYKWVRINILSNKIVVTLMADSTIATKDIENWIRNEFLPKKYHQSFSKQKLGIQSGGEFECDAVSEDGKIVCFISTSPVKTSDGQFDTGALANVREKTLWTISLNEKPETIVFACTDKSMLELVKKEKENGRFPKHIKTLLVKLPEDLEKKLAEMKKKAAEEMKK